MADLTENSEKQNRLEIIRQALKDKAPLMYEELESSGQLQIFLEAHDAEMMQSYMEAKNKAWDETMSTFLNFADASYSESSSPMG
jgi:hypothetical protein